MLYRNVILFDEHDIKWISNIVQSNLSLKFKFIHIYLRIAINILFYYNTVINAQWFYVTVDLLSHCLYNSYFVQHHFTRKHTHRGRSQRNQIFCGRFWPAYYLSRSRSWSGVWRNVFLFSLRDEKYTSWKWEFRDFSAIFCCIFILIKYSSIG